MTFRTWINIQAVDRGNGTILFAAETSHFVGDAGYHSLVDVAATKILQKINRDKECDIEIRIRSQRITENET